jgi:hypothetical protein
LTNCGGRAGASKGSEPSGKSSDCEGHRGNAQACRALGLLTGAGGACVLPGCFVCPLPLCSEPENSKISPHLRAARLSFAPSTSSGLKKRGRIIQAKEIVVRISEAEHSKFDPDPSARQIPELGAKRVPFPDGPCAPMPLSAEEASEERVGRPLVRPGAWAVCFGEALAGCEAVGASLPRADGQ